jgi:hypothetical protein
MEKRLISKILSILDFEFENLGYNPNTQEWWSSERIIESDDIGIHILKYLHAQRLIKNRHITMQEIMNYAQTQPEYHLKFFIAETLEPKRGNRIAGKEIFRRYKIWIGQPILDSELDVYLMSHNYEMRDFYRSVSAHIDLISQRCRINGELAANVFEGWAWKQPVPPSERMQQEAKFEKFEIPAETTTVSDAMYISPLAFVRAFLVPTVCGDGDRIAGTQIFRRYREYIDKPLTGVDFNQYLAENSQEMARFYAEIKQYLGASKKMRINGKPINNVFAGWRWKDDKEYEDDTMSASIKTLE